MLVYTHVWTMFRFEKYPLNKFYLFPKNKNKIKQNKQKNKNWTRMWFVLISNLIPCNCSILKKKTKQKTLRCVMHGALSTAKKNPFYTFLFMHVYTTIPEWIPPPPQKQGLERIQARIWQVEKVEFSIGGLLDWCNTQPVVTFRKSLSGMTNKNEEKIAAGMQPLELSHITHQNMSLFENEAKNLY